VGDIRFGLLLLPEGLTAFGELCTMAEDAGFGFLGVGDSQSIFGDVYVALAVAAQRTRQLRLGPMVTNPVSRHLVVTASAITSVDELSGGRAVLGLGSGDSALYTVGAPPATLAGLEDAVATLRSLLAGEVVERAPGQAWQVQRAGRAVPLYLSAEGPRTLRLAGRLADGVVVGLGLTPEVVEVSLRHLAEGAAEAGRSVDDLDVWWLVKANLGPIDDIKMALAASANHAFRFTRAGKALPRDLWERVEGLQGAYRASHHEVREGANAALTDRFGLTDYLAERFALWGGPDDVVRRVERARSAGARQFLLTGFVREPQRFIERWGDEVMPRL
jgi:5,10-methylenetetrahydromethanopterin reductase